MKKQVKTSQLQIRVSPQEKKALKDAAISMGMDLSSYILERLLSENKRKFQALCAEISKAEENSVFLAALNDLCATLNNDEFLRAFETGPQVSLDNLSANYIAAMIEHAAYKRNVVVAKWVTQIEPLEKPWFASELRSLRLYLLLFSPVAFCRRNIFIDSTVGDRV